jgi:hydrogenase 3 maturation protease
MRPARTWQSTLDRALRSLPVKDERKRPRVSILGIGRETHGDDVAGLMIVHDLAPHAHQDLQVLVGAHAPENQLGPICRFDPDLVLLIDAADMGMEPGEIAYLEWRNTTGISASTHTMPIYMMGKYLETMACCSVALIGIQPVSTDVDMEPSVEAQTAVDRICTGLIDRLCQPDRQPG